MVKDDCLFCKIALGTIPSSKFWENEDFIAILDIFPNTKGASLIISKEHITSDVFRADQQVLHKAVDAAKIAADMLIKALKPSRVSLVTEGVFVDHLHLKLYPLYEVGAFNNEEPAANEVYFEKFPGYVTTQSGPEWSREELDGLVKQIQILL